MFAANRYDFKYIILLMFLLMVPSLLFAAPIETVTNTNDAGAGSLRQAIADVDPGGEIIFAIPGGGPKTIVISAPLVVDKPMTITGPGETLLTVMSGGGNVQVLIVSDVNPTQIQVVISGITVVGDMTTLSGILNRENLTLNDVVITGAQDGITNSGQFSVGAVLTLNNSKLTGNSQSGLFIFGALEPGSTGGHVTINDSIINDNDTVGIINFGVQEEFAQGSKVVVNNTTISGNSSGIFNGGGNAVGSTGGILEVNNSSIINNVAPISTEGDGIVNEGGNAVDATGGTLVVRNSTISNNSGAAILALGGQVASSIASIIHVGSSSISGNKFALIIFPVPGVNLSPVVEVKNSILANSTSSNCFLNGQMFADLGVNISTDGTCPGFITTTPAGLNLGPLQDNGGPTDTQTLIPPSAAINIVNDCTFIDGSLVLEDQRGFLRPEFNCDAGAFELGGIPPGAKNIPVLSELGAIITVLLLGIVSMLYYRRKLKVLK